MAKCRSGAPLKVCSLASKGNDFGTLFETVMDGFRLVAESVEPIRRFYRIGKETLELRFAGGALLPVVSPALDHLAIEKAPISDLVIHIWDWQSAPKPASIILDCLMRSLSWHWTFYLNTRGEINDYNGQGRLAAFHPGPNILSLLDMPNRRAVYWAKDAMEVPWHESGSPMRTLLNWWTSHKGYQFVHGGAVGAEGEAFLIVGKGGTGKSTTCLACLEAGFRYLGDDYSLVNIQEEPWVFSLYNTAKLKGAEDLSRFPRLRRHLVNAERLNTEKAMMFLNTGYRDQIESGMPLKAILIPKIRRHTETEIRRAGPAEALAALAPSTLFQLPGSAQSAMQKMSELVKRVPCYVLELGANVSGIPEVLKALLLNKNWRNRN